MQQITYDTEFLEDGSTIMLISIGMVAADGREYYAVNADMDQFEVQRRDWLLENVWPQLPRVSRFVDHAESVVASPPHNERLDMSVACVKPKWVIANEVRDFILKGYDPTDDTEWGGDLVATLSSHVPPKLYAYFGAYDHVALAQLYGPMIDLPPGIPMFTHEIKQLIEDAVSKDPGFELPKQGSGAHNALSDARWNMMVLKQLGVVA